MNEVNARRARLQLGWVTVFGRVCHLGLYFYVSVHLRGLDVARTDIIKMMHGRECNIQI